MPTILANRREVAVAVVAAAFGGSVVAGAFAAASYLREFGKVPTEADSGWSTASHAVENAHNGRSFLTSWIRLLRRIFTIQEQRQITKANGEHTGGGTLVKADPFNPSKRTGYLSWNDYFMAIAFLSAQRSKDPNRQVGACLVSQDQVILGIGYNGFPRGCSDDELPWSKISVDGDPLKTKYPYVCHAEVNAILNKNHASAAGQKLYVTMFPCNECAKVIIQARVAEVIYFTDKGQSHSKNGQEAAFVASRRLLAMAGVKAWQYKPLQQALLLEYR